jgi:hypothetical protein
MSIADDLNWVVATKPKFGKSTEHSGAKKGKGAWDKKKVAKQTSNKGRRAGGKQEIKDQSVGEENDGPFPGAAPRFTKASELNWGQDQALSEPRPCYPSEEPVEDHCNPNISPDSNDNDSYVDDDEPMFDEGGGGRDEDYSGDPEGLFDSYEEEEDLDDEDAQDMSDMDNYREQTEPQEEAPDTVDPDVMDRSEKEAEDPMEFLDPGADPMEAPPEAPSPDQQQWSPEEWQQQMQKDVPEAPVNDPNDARRSKPMPRDPRLQPGEPHQFWQQEEDYIQEILPMVMERAKKGDPEAQNLIINGPRVGRYDKKSLFETMQDPAFWNKKGTQKYKQQIEREEGMEPGSLGPMGEDELQQIRDRYYSDDKPETIV